MDGLGRGGDGARLRGIRGLPEPSGSGDHDGRAGGARRADGEARHAGRRCVARLSPGVPGSRHGRGPEGARRRGRGGGRSMPLARHVEGAAAGSMAARGGVGRWPRDRDHDAARRHHAAGVWVPRRARAGRRGRSALRTGGGRRQPHHREGCGGTRRRTSRVPVGRAAAAPPNGARGGPHPGGRRDPGRGGRRRGAGDFRPRSHRPDVGALPGFARPDLRPRGDCDSIDGCLVRNWPPGVEARAAVRGAAAAGAGGVRWRAARAAAPGLRHRTTDDGGHDAAPLDR